MKKIHTEQDWVLIKNLAIYAELDFRISMEGWLPCFFHSSSFLKFIFIFC